MTVTTAIAIYAAAIGTAGFAWQLFTWLRANRVRLRVHVEGDIHLAAPRSTVTVARVILMNDSPFEVKIRRVFLFSFGESDPNRMWFPEEGDEDLQIAVPARDRITFRFPMAEGDLFADQTVRARVWTATGQEFLSPGRELHRLAD